MQLNTLKGKIRRKKSKKVGRGSGSGRGKTSGRGHKGAGQRKGSPHYIGLEGGNVPFLRKIPKRGFTSRSKDRFQVVNLGDIIARIKGKNEITPKELKEVNLIRKADKPVKILATINAKMSLKARFKAHSFSKKAATLITDAGGSMECLSQ